MDLNNHDFTLRQLQYAVAVADTQTFRAAAELCHVSQPSLSAQVAQLEAALGVVLFERTSRGVLLTHAGAQLVEKARLVLRNANDLASSARFATDPLRSTIRTGVIPTIGPYLIPVAARAFHKQHPQLQVQWVEDKTENLVSLLNDAAIDCALVALESRLGNVEHEVVASDPFVVAAHPEHAWFSSKATMRLDHHALDGEHVLLLDDGHCFRDQALEVCANASTAELAFRATSLATLAQMVASGAGVTLLPLLAVSTETSRADVKIRPFEAPSPSRTIAFVWRVGSPVGDAIRTLAHTLRNAYPQ